MGSLCFLSNNFMLNYVSPNNEFIFLIVEAISKNEDLTDVKYGQQVRSNPGYTTY